MDKCNYGYYENLNEHMPRLKCKITKGNCPYSKVCYVVNKYIFNEDYWKECPMRIDEERKDIPKGAYYIQTKRLNKKGNYILYIVTDNDAIIEVYTNFTEVNQNYVYLYKTQNGYEAFLEKKKNVKK